MPTVLLIMHCPYCNTVNDEENSFCVSCGKTIPNDLKTNSDFVPPTEIYVSGSFAEPPSLQTAFPPKHVQQQQLPSFSQSIPNQSAPAKKSGKGLIIGLVFALLMIAGIIGVGGYFLWKQQQQPGSAEVLPDHLGFFVQNADQSKLVEIKQNDISNAVDENEKIVTDESLPDFGENASFVLFSDAKDVAITDLKLVQLDSIKDDGSMSQIDFHAAPIAENQSMKRLRLPAGLAKGKYAFAIFKGLLNQGNHKFWAFQVKESKKANNDDVAKPATIAVNAAAKPDTKEKPNATGETVKREAEVPKRESKAAPPSGATVAYCSGNDVLLRGSPSLNGKKIGKLSKGQRIYVMYYSENYDEWRGKTANWAYVQTEGGGRGWVFTPFVYY